MKVYLASSASRKDMKACIEIGYPFLLLSFHYFKKDTDLLQEFKGIPGVDFFLDSGAFSSDSIGAKIDIDKYISFIKEHGFDKYAVLDDLKSPQKTWDNMLYMEERGMKPIPVFHMGDSIIWLDKYLESHEFLALGGMVKNNGIEDWLDVVWNHIYKRNPSLKVHGFGMTTPDFLIKYPWTSVDSSAYAGAVRWARVSRFDETHGILYDESAHEFAKSIGEVYIPGTPITGKFRLDIIREGMMAYKKLMDWTNMRVMNRDFSYLSSQINVFDLEPEIISIPQSIIKDEIHDRTREITHEIPPEPDESIDIIPDDEETLIKGNQYLLF